MTPFDDFAYLINHILLGEEPTIEDFILLIGTIVAFIAFILWCCFPINTKDNMMKHHKKISYKTIRQSICNSHNQQNHQHLQIVKNESQHNYSKNNINNHTNFDNDHIYHCCTT